MLTKFDAIDHAYEKATFSGNQPKEAVDLHEWINSNYTQTQIPRMYQYCKWVRLIDLPFGKMNTGHKLNLYETINHFVSLDEDGFEIFREQLLLKPFGQIFLRHLFRICAKHQVEDYCDIEE